MTAAVEYQQHQHQEFKRLVFKEVYEAALNQGMELNAYIASVYFDGSNPLLFVSRSGMQNLYERFGSLIESTISSDHVGDIMSTLDTVYLCFRVYLHLLCMERKRMPESGSELFLQDAVKDYFQAAAKVLIPKDERRIMRYLKRQRQQALNFPDY